MNTPKEELKSDCCNAKIYIDEVQGWHQCGECWNVIPQEDHIVDTNEMVDSHAPCDVENACNACIKRDKDTPTPENKSIYSFTKSECNIRGTCTCISRNCISPTYPQSSEWEEEFDKKVKELKNQKPAHLRESEPVEFGYTVDRDDEIFRVVDFGNIKRFISSLLKTARQEEYKAKYEELIYAVGNKYENETRHETALRYIKQAELTSTTEISKIFKSND